MEHFFFIANTPEGEMEPITCRTLGDMLRAFEGYTHYWGDQWSYTLWDEHGRTVTADDLSARRAT